MPDNSEAADEQASLHEITAPLATLPDDAVQTVADTDFQIVLRGYDRVAVDTYVRRTSQLVAELQATHSPEGAVRRALERVGEEVSGILQRAHETAERVTAQSRREAEDRLERSRQEAAQMTAGAEQRVKDLDVETDRIWAERQRIVEDTRQLARQLLVVAESALERFPTDEDTEENEPAGRPPGSGPFDDAGQSLFDREASSGETLDATGFVDPEGGGSVEPEEAGSVEPDQTSSPVPDEAGVAEPLPTARAGFEAELTAPAEEPHPEVFTRRREPESTAGEVGYKHPSEAGVPTSPTGSDDDGPADEQPTAVFPAVTLNEEETLRRPIWERGTMGAERSAEPGEAGSPPGARGAEPGEPGTQPGARGSEPEGPRASYS